MWGLGLLGTRGMILTGLTLAGIAVLGLLIWRMNYLSDKVATQNVAIAGYERTMAELLRDTVLRERIALADNAATLADERTRATEIGLIEGTRDEEDGPVAPVLAATVERLFRDHPGTGSD